MDITSPELEELALQELKQQTITDGEDELQEYYKEDDHNQEYISYVNNSDYVGTVEVNAKCIGEVYEYTLDNRDSHGSEYILKNLRFKNKNDINKVTNYEWNVGGEIFDKFPSDFYTKLQIFYEMNEIPFYIFNYGATPHKYHDNKVLLRGNELSDVVLLIDKYKGDKVPQFLEYMIYQNVYQTFTGNRKHKLKCSNINFFLMANKKLQNIEIHKPMKNQEDYIFKAKQDKNGIINLTNNLKLNQFTTYCSKFSLSSDLSISYNCEEEDVIIGSLSSNIITYSEICDMVGLRFNWK